MNRSKDLLKLVEDGSGDLESIFPLRAESGQVVGANGKWLVRVNRDRGESPLDSPVDRDALIHYIAEHLNHNQGEFKDFVNKYKKK